MPYGSVSALDQYLYAPGNVLQSPYRLDLGLDGSSYPEKQKRQQKVLLAFAVMAVRES